MRRTLGTLIASLALLFGVATPAVAAGAAVVVNVDGSASVGYIEFWSDGHQSQFPPRLNAIHACYWEHRLSHTAAVACRAAQRVRYRDLHVLQSALVAADQRVRTVTKYEIPANLLYRQNGQVVSPDLLANPPGEMPYPASTPTGTCSGYTTFFSQALGLPILWCAA